MDFMRSWTKAKPNVVTPSPALNTPVLTETKQPQIASTVPLLKLPEDHTRPAVTPPGSRRMMGAFISSPSMRRKKMEGMADLEKMVQDTSGSGLLNTNGERQRKLSFPNFSNFNESND